MDVDHITSLCIQIPKQETVKTAESKITNLIYLKHTLELIDPLQDSLKDSENELFLAYREVRATTDIILVPISNNSTNADVNANTSANAGVCGSVRATYKAYDVNHML